MRSNSLVAVLAWSLWSVPAVLAQQPPALRSAASFAILAGSAVVSSGNTTVAGNVGVSPGNAINLPDTAVTLGGIFRDDSIARAAQRDSAVAYDDLAGRACVPLQGSTVVPGVYCLSSALIGTLTLDAGSNPDAVWMFRSTGALTTAADASVRVINGGYESNVFWQVGTSAILDERTAFIGTILARDNITLNAGASLSGRALAQTGTVTLNGNNVSLCCKPITLAPVMLADGKVGTRYVPTTITASGGTGSFTFSVPRDALPDWLTLSDGMLSGTPTRVSQFTRQSECPFDGQESKPFTVTARDTVTGCVGTRDYTIGVTCDLPITFSPVTLPKGTVRVPYPTTQIMATGPKPFVKGPFRFSASSLPMGLSLSCDGVLSGTPTEHGVSPFTFTVTAVDTISGCSGSFTYTITVYCPPITISPMSLRDGTVGMMYSATITAAGGTPPYRFSVVPNPPVPGLVLSPLSPTTTTGPAMISRTPTTSGTFAFTVTVTDVQGCSATQEYTITIGPCQIFLFPSTRRRAASEMTAQSIDVTTLPPATPGVAYNQTITASGGAGPPYTFNVTAGSLPAGLMLNPKIPGVISNTPYMTAVSSIFTLTATDALGCTGDQAFRICLPITIQPETLPDAIAGTLYSVKLVASGGTKYTFSPVGPLPGNGLMLSAAGLISGMPITPTALTDSRYGPLMVRPRPTFTVTAVDICTGCSGMKTYSLPLVTCPTITISTPALPNGNVGTPYSQTITATGGTAPYAFTLASGSFPPGLTLASGGALTGTPTTTGTYCFSVKTSSAGCPGNPVAYTIVIDGASCPPGTIITLSPPSLPPASTGVPYSQTITASGGTPPYTFAVTSGVLPPGLTLNSATGLVSGTPTAGVFPLAISATDANGCVGSMGCGFLMTVDIPTLSGWGLVMLSLLLAGAGILMIGRGPLS